MTRLVIAHPHFTYPGGASAVALETAERLARLGYDVHVAALRRSLELTSRFTGIAFHDLAGPLSSELRYWLTLPAIHRRFNRLVDGLQPDVLLAHVFPANYWAFVYRARRPWVPCVWYCHEPSAFVHDRAVIGGVPWPMRGAVLAANPPLQVGDRILVRFADEIVANSRFTAERVAHVYGRAASIAYPGVDSDWPTVEEPKERLILAVGRLTRFKRFDLFLDAAALLRQRGYDARWVIVGDGESADELRTRAANLQIADVVTFAGRVDEETLRGYYRRALAVAVTSIGEPFGIVPIEAMMAGTAVICSDSGGPTESVRHGETGLHFSSGDARELARAMASLLDNPDRAVAFGAAGRGLAHARYTWEQTTAGIGQAIERALAARTRASKR